MVTAGAYFGRRHQGPAGGFTLVEHGQKIWRNGEIVDWETAGSTSLLTHTLHYGVGAFEGIRAYKRAKGETTIFRLKEHINRLMESCRLVMLKPRVSAEQVCDGCVAVLRANKLDEAYLRPLITMGAGAMGVYAPNNPIETHIITWKWGAYLGAEALEKGIRCKVSSFSRHHINVSFAKGKLVGQYINSVMAKQEAKLDGFDEAILTDVNGYVSEGSGENIFIVKNGTITTPPLSASILAGITRDTLITLAREAGITVREEYVTRDELYLADEVFFTGTAAEVTPVVEVDHRMIGAAVRGEITRSLQARYFDIVKGKDESHPEWHTPV
jgi:branched-chain amino acid aminotransferase